MRLARFPILSLALAACGTGLHDLDDSGADDTDSPVRIDLIDPNWGPTAGEAVVTVQGAGFEGQLAVYFDETPVEAFRVDTETLLLTTPSWPSEDTVDIRIESALGTGRLQDGFTYSDDGAPPAPGGVGGLGEFTFLLVACPDCFGYTTDLFVSAAVAFHEPSSGSWIGWLPAAGTCANNPAKTSPASSYDDVGQWVYLNSGSSSIPLQRTSGSAGPYYASNGLGDADYLRNAAFSVEGPFTVQGAVHTTEGFTDIQPVEMLYVNPSYAFSAAISRSGQTFTWADSGIASRFVIVVEVYNSGGTAYLGNVVCTGPDTGSMRVPAANLQAYPSGSLLAVGLYRYQITQSRLPDESTFEGISWSGVVGTGTLY